MRGEVQINVEYIDFDNRKNFSYKRELTYEKENAQNNYFINASINVRIVDGWYS